MHFQILNHDFPAVIKTTMYTDKNFATPNTPAVPPSWTDRQGESLNERQWRRSQGCGSLTFAITYSVSRKLKK